MSTSAISSPSLARPIADAAEEVIHGKLDDHFPLVVWQTGSGTQSQHERQRGHLEPRHRDARRRRWARKSRSTPTITSTVGQSSNDSLPTAMHIAAVAESTTAWSRRSSICEGAGGQSRSEFKDIIKIGRTHLQDATPVTLGPGILRLRRSDRATASRASSRRLPASTRSRRAARPSAPASNTRPDLPSASPTRSPS